MIQGNITRNVRVYLSKDLSIQKNLQRGILNIRALARRIIREQNLKTSIDAVISAIRRFSYDKRSKKEVANAEEVFKYANVATKNNISCVVLRNQSDIQKYLSEIAKTINFEKRETLRLVKGKNNLKILINTKNIGKIKDILSNENVDIKENLSEITIKTSLKADQTKGVVARLSNEMMLRDINISEIIFCVPEIIVYVEQRDLLKAHESIIQLCQGE